MKICWDNLEHLVYLPKIGKWRDLYKHYWSYVDKCEICREPFLTNSANLNSNRGNRGKICSAECKSIYMNGKGLPDNLKKTVRKLLDEDRYLKVHGSNLLRGAKRRSILKNIEFDLDLLWVLRKLKKGRCEMSGIQFEYNTKTHSFVPSIDRIDNHRGYTKDNCRIILFLLNSWKGICTDKDVYEVAKSFVEKYNNERIYKQDT